MFHRMHCGFVDCLPAAVAIPRGLAVINMAVIITSIPLGPGEYPLPQYAHRVASPTPPSYPAQPANDAIKALHVNSSCRQENVSQLDSSSKQIRHH